MQGAARWHDALMKLFWVGLLMIVPAILVEAYQDRLITTQSINAVAAIGAVFAALSVFGMLIYSFIQRIHSHSKG
jgi:hypothetical protein